MLKSYVMLSYSQSKTHYPKYIIGHTTKKQIMKLFNKLKG